MDVDRFWELNEGLTPDLADKELPDRLSKLDPSEIASYHFISHSRQPISGIYGRLRTLLMVDALTIALPFRKVSISL